MATRARLEIAGLGMVGLNAAGSNVTDRKLAGANRLGRARTVWAFIADPPSRPAARLNRGR
jgi:hypothetical protein